MVAAAASSIKILTLCSPMSVALWTTSYFNVASSVVERGGGGGGERERERREREREEEGEIKRGIHSKHHKVQ